jgi:acyl dehydratase
MATFADIDALTRAIGSDLGVSEWRLVTQEHVNMFAEATNAHEWIHIDVERASRESPFGRTVAHGYFTLSLATSFVTQLLDVRAPLLGINYGLNRVRFPSAVPVGTRVRAQGRLKHVEPSPAGLQTLVELTYELEDGGKPPCTAEVVSLLRPQTPSDTAPENRTPP